MAKIITAAEAADLIRDGMTLGVSGFGAFASPDYVMEAMSRKFKEQNTPRDLTIVSGVAPGDFVEDGCGLSKIKDEGICDGVHIMAIGAEKNVPAILDKAGVTI